MTGPVRAPGLRRLLPQIVFVVGFGKAVAGSVQMRGPQLAALVAPELAARARVRCSAMPGGALLQRLWSATIPDGTTLFLTKRTILDLLPETRVRLQRRGVRVWHDYVDTDLNAAQAAGADGHVASSFAQRDRLLELQAAGRFAPGPVQVVLHNADLQLYRQSPPRRATAAAVYCGTPAMTVIPRELAGRVDVLDASSAPAMKRVLPRLLRYPVHWCLRAGDPPGVIKPFTKGTVAALCRANVVVTRDVPDAVAFLGDDYPFYAEGMAPAAAAAALDAAEAAFGGPEWRRAEEIMRDVAERVGPHAIAAQVMDLVKES